MIETNKAEKTSVVEQAAMKLGAEGKVQEILEKTTRRIKKLLSPDKTPAIQLEECKKWVACVKPDSLIHLALVLMGMHLKDGDEENATAIAELCLHAEKTDKAAEALREAIIKALEGKYSEQFQTYYFVHMLGSGFCFMHYLKTKELPKQRQFTETECDEIEKMPKEEG